MEHHVPPGQDRAASSTPGRPCRNEPAEHLGTNSASTGRGTGATGPNALNTLVDGSAEAALTGESHSVARLVAPAPTLDHAVLPGETRPQTAKPFTGAWRRTVLGGLPGGARRAGDCPRTGPAVPGVGLPRHREQGEWCLPDGGTRPGRPTARAVRQRTHRADIGSRAGRTHGAADGHAARATAGDPGAARRVGHVRTRNRRRDRPTCRCGARRPVPRVDGAARSARTQLTRPSMTDAPVTPVRRRSSWPPTAQPPRRHPTS